MFNRNKSALLGIFLCIGLAQTCYPVRSPYFPQGPATALAVIDGQYENHIIIGIASFIQNTYDDPIQISLNISGLPKNYTLIKHGLHVHTMGISTLFDDGHYESKADQLEALEVIVDRPHFNPTNEKHGDINEIHRHVGDYGNVLSDENGLINYKFSDKVSKLYGPFGIIGRTLVLHINEDDGGVHSDSGSLSSGNSGLRVACGIIGIS